MSVGVGVCVLVWGSVGKYGCGWLWVCVGVGWVCGEVVGGGDLLVAEPVEVGVVGSVDEDLARARVHLPCTMAAQQL